MSGRVYKIQVICLIVFGGIWQTNRLALYCNTPFPLNVHGVEDLILKIPIQDNIGRLDQAIGKR